jgi:NADH dehydrogenase
MQIVLLGATGFVGHHLLTALSNAGHQCRVLSRQPDRHRDLKLIPGVSLLGLDVWDTQKLAGQISGADLAINLVGILNEPGRNGMGFWKVHVQLVENLLDACNQAGVKRLIHMSALNAGQGSSYYLTSKGRAEELIAESTGLDWTIIQPSVMFGELDSFFNRFATLLKWMPVFPLACHGSRLQPVWVGDVCRAMTRIVAEEPGSPAISGQTLVMVGPQEYTLEELVRYTAQTLKLKRWIVRQPDLVSRLQGAILDFIPGKPFSSDNFRSLQTDSTSVENALWRFGIEPQHLERIVPYYLNQSGHQQRLDRFRAR